MKLFRLSLYLAITALMTLRVASAQNLIQNGDFSSGSGFDDWTVSGNIGQGGENPPDETFAAVFNAGDASPNGVLSQTFATTIGDSYQLQFEYNTFTFYGIEQTLDVSVTSPGLVLAANAVGPVETPGPGTVFDYTFTAGAASATLTFADDSDNFSYSTDGILGNVAVTDLSSAPSGVPDGSSTSLLLGFSAVLLVAASSFQRRRARA